MKMTVHHNVGSLDERIRHIRARVAHGVTDPDVYAFARAAVAQRCGDRWCTPEKDNLREMEAIFNAIRNQVRYTSDILGIDTYQNPGRTLRMRSGDCDDYSSLVCASLLSLGIPCRFKVIRTKDASEWNHIYAQGGLPRANPQRWYTLDASVNKPFGWEAPAGMIAESRIFPVR
jgi:transglutaminase-like putative cysteine protease